MDRDIRRSVSYVARDRRNPFVDSGMDFGDAAHVVEEIGERFGRWQDLECRSLKNSGVRCSRARLPLCAFQTGRTAAEKVIEDLPVNQGAIVDEVVRMNRVPQCTVPYASPPPCSPQTGRRSSDGFAGVHPQHKSRLFRTQLVGTSC